MLALALTALRKIELIEVPPPTLKQDMDVLVKIQMAGICGSDVHYFEDGRIGARRAAYPFILGHECSGLVAETGPGATRVRAGDRVAVDPAMVCHRCDQCRAGRQNTCRHLSFLGCPGEAPGCMSEYIVVPDDCLYPLPPNISIAQAVLAEPLSIGLYSVLQARCPAGSHMAILGAGPIGLSVLRAVQEKRPGGIFMTDRVEARIQAARQAQADWVGNPDTTDVDQAILQLHAPGMDVVFECAGQQETLDQAQEILKPGGALVVVGIPRTERVSFNMDLLRRKELTVINIRRQNRCVQAALDLIARRPGGLDFMITHTATPMAAQEMFERVAGYRDGVIKALLDFGAPTISAQSSGTECESGKPQEIRKSKQP